MTRNLYIKTRFFLCISRIFLSLSPITSNRLWVQSPSTALLGSFTLQIPFSRLQLFCYVRSWDITSMRIHISYADDFDPYSHPSFRIRRCRGGGRPEDTRSSTTIISVPPISESTSTIMMTRRRLMIWKNGWAIMLANDLCPFQHPSNWVRRDFASLVCPSFHQLTVAPCPSPGPLLLSGSECGQYLVLTLFF